MQMISCLLSFERTAALEMRNKIDEIEDLVQKEENPSRIKALLNDIKNLSIGVAGSLIASGIVTLLSRV